MKKSGGEISLLLALIGIVFVINAATVSFLIIDGGTKKNYENLKIIDIGNKLNLANTKNVKALNLVWNNKIPNDFGEKKFIKLNRDNSESEREKIFKTQDRKENTEIHKEKKDKTENNAKSDIENKSAESVEGKTIRFGISTGLVK